jgi:ATP phosphoribosyltransferase regulatory subunit
MQQAGAELYGHAGIEADIEVRSLLIAALHAVGVSEVRLDLGHVGVFRSLVENARVPDELQPDLFAAVQAKDEPEVAQLTRDLDAANRAALIRLPTLFGGARILDRAARELPNYPAISRALADLRAIAEGVESVSFDLAELRGYQYHSGVVFAAYGGGRVLAYGGRYDEVGRAFGNARPATGFTIDLRELARAAPLQGKSRTIRAPHADDPSLSSKISELRHAGERVVVDLPGHEPSNADFELIKRGNDWQVKESR